MTLSPRERAIVLGAEARAAAGNRQVQVLPGTALEVVENEAVALPLCRVHMDGQPPDMSLTVPIISGTLPHPGDRVMVQFDPPHGANLFAIYGLGHVGGRPYATYVGSALNSFAPGHLTTDFVCSGVDDHVLIQFYIDRCASNGGGRVELLEGDYSVGLDQLVVPSSVTLSGQGPQTRLVLAGDGPGVAVTTSGMLSRLAIINASGFTDYTAVRFLAGNMEWVDHFVEGGSG